MELFIIRHGQSANNALADLRDREVDPPLTDLGKIPAEILAQHLASGETHDMTPGLTIGWAKTQLRKGFGITSVFCSPMYRSLQTVQPVAQALDLAAHI